MNMQTPVSAAEIDIKKYNAVDAISVPDMIAYAAKKTGRSALHIGREFNAMNKSFRRINTAEYIRWKLYDDTRFSEAERNEFISNDVHWPLVHKVNPPSWQSAAEDKVLAATILSADGVAVPHTIAVIDTSPRTYPGLRKISSGAELRDVIADHGDAKLFGKMLDGMVSFGAFRVLDADATHITCDGHDPMTYDAFVSDFLGGRSYLLQKRLDNHSDMAPFATGLATVRMINLVRKNDVLSPIAIISMPQGDNVADTLWRNGNIACEVDVASGKIKTIVRRDGPEIAFLNGHPSAPGLMGLTLPDWDRLRGVNEQATRLFGAIKYQSTDIAITQDGPVIVELNYGSGFGLPQNASGRGLLTPEVRAFFEENGCKLDGSEVLQNKPAKTGFRLFGKRG